MDYSTELKRINDKYYHKIKKEYSKYIKNFDSIPDLTQNVYIIPDNKCIDDYEDLAVGKNRGRCDADTGNIYIRESAFCEHLLIHEFIHRLSRNKVKIRFFKRQWVEGVMFLDKKVALFGLNEVLTEWFAFQITNIIEANNCQLQFPFIKNIFDTNDTDSIAFKYFNNMYEDLINMFYATYGLSVYDKINQLNTCVIKGFPCPS